MTAPTRMRVAALLATARLLPGYDSGDHLHPNDAGMVVMARAVPLRLFR